MEPADIQAVSTVFFVAFWLGIVVRLLRRGEDRAAARIPLEEGVVLPREGAGSEERIRHGHESEDGLTLSGAQQQGLRHER